jgi:hypothetical protein
MNIKENPKYKSFINNTEAMYFMRDKQSKQRTKKKKNIYIKLLITLGLVLLLLLLLYSFILLYKTIGNNPIKSTRNLVFFMILYILPLFIFYNLFRIWNCKSTINFIFSLLSYLAIMYIISFLNDNYDNEYLKKQHGVIYGIVTYKTVGYRMPSRIRYIYIVNNIRHSRAIDIPKIPVKGIVPRFRDKFNMSVGDTVLITYSIEKPEISRIYKFKPTSKEIRKYIEQDTVTKQDTISARSDM